MVDFGKSLSHHQEMVGMSSSDLARRLGVHRQQVNIWRNKKNVRLDTAIKVANAFDMGLDEFLAIKIND